jgi:hypothetical protein
VRLGYQNLSLSDRVVLGGTCKTGYQVIETGYQVIETGYQVIEIGYQVIEIGYQVIEIGYQVPVLLLLSCFVRQVI